MVSETERPPDDVLMTSYSQGNVTAFHQLYECYERRIYSFCLRYLGDADAAADAFQDVFVRVIDARHRYEARGRFSSWIFTVARRVCLDKIRADRPTESVDGPAAQSQLGRTIDPADQVAAADELQRLLSGLSSEHREILLLNRYHGFTYGEIAEMTDSSEAAVKQKAYRALESLRASRDLKTYGKAR